MKTTFRFMVLVLFGVFATNICNAQLRVRTNGSVKIGSGVPIPDAGDLQIVQNNQTTEARIFATSANIARLWTLNSVYAYAFGIDQTGYGRIWGNLNSPTNIISINTSGSVGINYNPGTQYKLYVGGSAYCSGVWQPSDRRLKTDILPIEDAVGILQLIKGKTYYYLTENIPRSDKIESKQRRYGFIAQEVKEVLPDLVQELEDSCRSLAINYDGFIPLLVEAIKEEHNKVLGLENEINYLILSCSGNKEINSSNKLFQNAPNPFHSQTEIEYYVDESAGSAIITICNLHGLQIKSYENINRGKSKIVIHGSELNPGMYIYNLIVDGRLIDTKQMILIQ